MRRVHPGRGLPAEGRRRRGETTVVFGKPRETVGQQNYGTKVKGSFPMLCSPGCNLANHGKLWDAKHNRIPVVFILMPSRNHRIIGIPPKISPLGVYFYI